MYILVTDILACPRCGPEAGLILLANRIEARRVLEGALACPNCRTRYPIRHGFAELGGDAATPAAAPTPTHTEPEPDAAVRMLALLGITDGPANMLVLGPAARHAAAMAELIEGLEVIAAERALEHDAERHGVTRIGVGASLPFYSHSLRGVVLDGPAAAALLEDAVRVLRPAGRLVVAGPDAQTRPRVEAAGARVLAADQDWLVATPA